MKTIFGVLLFSWMMATACADDALRVMSFNVRFASTNPPNSWAERRPIMKSCLRRTNPDIVGMQEALYLQVKDMAEDLPKYAWIGLGREGGSRGEFMAVFYRKDRFEPLEFDHFWLSDTPDRIGSSTWGNENRRMVTWVKFLDHETKKPFYFFNTHFDHKIQEAREKSAALVRKRIAALNNSLPVILTGDFNAPAGKNKAYSILTEDSFMTDTWNTAKKRVHDDIGTFNGFKSENPGGPRIDWILTRNGVSCDKIEIVTFNRDGKYPSDHFPLLTELRFESEN